MREILKVMGPYLMSIGRKQVNVYYKDGSVVSKLLSRHIMEQHIGRELSKNEEVDHIDADKTNDSIENLQILSTKEHLKKTALEANIRAVITIKCKGCNCDISTTQGDVRYRTKKTKEKDGIFCSPQCNRKYSGSGRPAQSILTLICPACKISFTVLSRRVNSARVQKKMPASWTPCCSVRCGNITKKWNLREIPLLNQEENDE